VIYLKTQAIKYAQVLKSIAKVTDVGPYNKVGDPEEANVTVMCDFVARMDTEMEGELEEYAKLVFTHQLRKGIPEIEAQQKQMLINLTEELQKDKANLTLCNQHGNYSIRQMET
jgi:hypothetical protein